jgi:tetratricopeptide (TPR) repeat protein
MLKDPLKEVRIRKRIEQAQLDQVAGRFAAARTIYEELLISSANHPDVMHGLGVLCVQEGHYQDAERWLLHAIESNPGQARNWNDLGEAMRHMGKAEDAIAAYRKAIILQPEFVEALNNLGVALAGQGQIEEAKHCFLEAIRLDAEYPNPHNNLGVLLESENMFDVALKSYESAVRLKPDYTEAMANYTNLLTRQPERVIESMNRLLEVAKKI